ncbi:MAG: carbamoyltransferase [Candidatus Coatesbacteria bacterium]|nr:MAG: carbamoyltransferase [Candidatus Coatesbacteria bacterium]
MFVLGVNDCFHDNSAALVCDGELVCSIEDERLDRIKHTAGICWGGEPPYGSIEWCLNEAGVKPDQIDAVAYSVDMNAYLALEQLAKSIIFSYKKMSLKNILKLRFARKDLNAGFLQGLTYGYFVKRKRFLREMRRRFPNARFFDVKHHLAHAASAFRLSGFDRANIIVVDGLGERYSTSLYVGEGNVISAPIRQYTYTQSLGAMYKNITFYLGFGYFQEGKTMGLSAYGEFDERFANVVNVSDGEYKVDLNAIKKLGKYARYDGELLKTHKDIAMTLQTQLERIGVALAKTLYERTGYRNLCLGGGVALNCCMNSAILNSPYVDHIYVQPAAMDNGTALGAAMEGYARLGFESKSHMSHVYWGPEFENDEIEAEIVRSGLPYRRSEDICRDVARLLVDQKIVGWFQGRMEIGPRALGARSILADPRSPEMKDRVNIVKSRELWRPLAPSILEERVDDWFENAYPSPFMNLNLFFKAGVKEKVPSVVHADGSARVQTVSRHTNPLYHRLISEFEKLTGVPIVLNTSFNTRGEPIVCTPAEGLRTFKVTGMDYLAIGDFIVERGG